MDIKQQFIIKAIKKFGNKFDYSNLNYINKHVVTKFTCPIHGDFYTPPGSFIKNREGCPKCGTITHNRKMLEYYKQKAFKKHNGYYNYDLINLDNYLNSSTKVPIVCPKHGVFYSDMYHHSKKTRCPKCVIDNKHLTIDEFINRSNKIHNFKYDYSLVSFKYIVDMVKIICPIHGVFEQEVRSHLSKCGCSKCSYESKFSTADDFIKKAKEIHGDRYLYDKVIYRGNKKKVIITCKKHGDFMVKPNAHLSNKTGCVRCRTSFGEIGVENLLKDINIQYIREYTPPDSPARYRYDFYIPEFNLFLEFHGKQHYTPVNIFGGEKEFLETKRRDTAKIELAKKLGIKLIVIHYRHLYNKTLNKFVFRKMKQYYKYWIKSYKGVERFIDELDLLKSYPYPNNLEYRLIPKYFKEHYPELQIINY